VGPHLGRPEIGREGSCKEAARVTEMGGEVGWSGPVVAVEVDGSACLPLYSIAVVPVLCNCNLATGSLGRTRTASSAAWYSQYSTRRCRCGGRPLKPRQPGWPCASPDPQSTSTTSPPLSLSDADQPMRCADAACLPAAASDFFPLPLYPPALLSLRRSRAVVVLRDALGPFARSYAIRYVEPSRVSAGAKASRHDSVWV